MTLADKILNTPIIPHSRFTPINPHEPVKIRHCPRHNVVYRDGDECGLCFDNRKAGEFTEIEILRAKQRMLLGMLDELTHIIREAFRSPRRAELIAAELELFHSGIRKQQKLWE